VSGLDPVGTREIRRRPGNSQEPLDSTGAPTLQLRQLDGVGLLSQSEPAGGPQGPAAEPRVGNTASLDLAKPRLCNPTSYNTGRLRRGRSDVLIGLYTWHVDPQVHPVPKRPRNATGIALHHTRLAAASTIAARGIAARARVQV
jgi:hypothetical protein